VSKNIVKEFYAGKTEGSSDLSVVFILEDNKELRLQIPREVTINMNETIFLALDTKGLYRPRPKDTH